MERPVRRWCAPALRSCRAAWRPSQWRLSQRMRFGAARRLRRLLGSSLARRRHQQLPRRALECETSTATPGPQWLRLVFGCGTVAAPAGVGGIVRARPGFACHQSADNKICCVGLAPTRARAGSSVRYSTSSDLRASPATRAIIALARQLSPMASHTTRDY